MRIGLVGTESDHAADFLRMLNATERNSDARIVALWGEEAIHTASLASRFAGVTVEASPDAIADHVDAAVIVVRHGNRHRDLALPFLARGLPVFIDKPLACSLADAEAILTAARQTGAPVLSASALRWQPDTEALAARIAEFGGATSLTATGTFYPDSPYGGLYYYGIHAAELAVQLAGNAVANIAVERAGPDGVVVRCHVAQTDVAVRLVPPAAPGEVIFHVEAVCAAGVVESVIGLGDDYMAPVVDRFVAMMHSRKAPLLEEEMRAPIALLDAADTAFKAARS